MKFRIVQTVVDTFVVERQYTRTFGMLWWKEQIPGWIPCNKYGNEGNLYNPTIHYKTMAAALKAIKKFHRGTIIHQVDA